MPTAYYAPGVYIEEPDKGTKPIQGVATSVTAFIGFTKRAEKLNDDEVTTRSILGEPTLVTSWAQFEKHFGGFDENAYLPYSVRGFFDNGGTRCYITSVRTTDPHKAQKLLSVLYKKDKEDKGKNIAGLLAIAKDGGTKGNDLQVQIVAASKTSTDDPLTNDSRKNTAYSISVRDGENGTYSPLKNWVQRAKARAAVEEAKRQEFQTKRDEWAAQEKKAKKLSPEERAKELAKLQQEVTEKKSALTAKSTEQVTLKDTWQTAGIDLSLPERRWNTVKAEWLRVDENSGKEGELDTARQQFATLTSEIEAARTAVADAEATLTAAQTSADIDVAKAKAEWEKSWTEKLKATEEAREQWAFELEDLPFWGESSRADQQKIANAQSDLVQLWRLHKRGKEAEAQPVAVSDVKLEGGCLSIDHLFLRDKQLITKTEFESAANDNGEVVFKEKSTALYQGDEAKRKGVDGFYAYDDINLVCAPDVMMAYKLMDEKSEADTIVKGLQESILTFCKRAHYPFAILDTPNIKDVQAINEWRMNLPGGDTMHGALYYPWIKIADPFNAGRQIEIPPSGHMAGIYARSDSQRGVHKAPANEIVSGAIDLTINVTKAEQELLNPNGINCIRQFPGRGIRVWGARTLSMTDPSWRYINVRRLFSYVEASVERSTQWVVFEPNDYALWAKVRRDVTAFLRTVWLSGALFGLTPEQSFYVKCDEETNPSELRDLGQMVCEIGMSPVKPAEFVIFRFSQWAGQEA